MISYSSIIIKDYFTPATPEGDTALLDAIMVTPVAAGLSSEPAWRLGVVGSVGLGTWCVIS